MKPILLIMAAGLGSRFGGVKQLARVGANGEAILDFSISDAMEAGFGSVVMIVRSEIEADVRAHIDEQHPGLDVTYVRQDDFGVVRAKPWGTLHAVLSARPVLDKPFAVINADDYYGPKSFVIAAEQLASITPGHADLIAFELANTVPPSGAVTRGVCEIDAGMLVGIVETDGCEKLPGGVLMAGGVEVEYDTPVSMNLWCFHDKVLADFDARWQAFFVEFADTPKRECQLPTVVGELMADGLIEVAAVHSPEQWIGITNPDDLALAKDALGDR